MNLKLDQQKLFSQKNREKKIEKKNWREPQEQPEGKDRNSGRKKYTEKVKALHKLGIEGDFPYLRKNIHKKIYG